VTVDAQTAKGQLVIRNQKLPIAISNLWEVGNLGNCWRRALKKGQEDQCTSNQQM
jgi:hypothetical protein